MAFEAMRRAPSTLLRRADARLQSGGEPSPSRRAGGIARNWNIGVIAPLLPPEAALRARGERLTFRQRGAWGCKVRLFALTRFVITPPAL